MRLSIWHQFSSNHSAGFTIVGQFQTEAEAQQVAEEIRSILQQVAEWHGGVRDARTAHRWRSSNQRVTPIEAILRDEYGLTTWTDPIDYATQPDKVKEAVRTLSNTVFVAEAFIGKYTWTGDKPFTELMQKLGGKVAVASETGDTSILVTLSCRAPDEQVANQLVDAPQDIDHGRSYVRLPIPIELRVSKWSDSDYRIGTIHRDGLKVTFTDLDASGNANWALDFFAILAYLESLGCTDFEYSFREIGDDDEFWDQK